MAYLDFALKFLHILGAMVLFGTGLGIAFFMWMAHRTGDAAIIAHTARTVVLADFVFTATAVVVQPLTGALLMEFTGYPWSQKWVVLSLGLYGFAGLCWLPVVWIQIRLRKLSAEAARRGDPLPAAYHRLFRAWFVLGWPAFLAVLAILWLMIARPQW